MLHVVTVTIAWHRSSRGNYTTLQQYQYWLHLSPTDDGDSLQFTWFKFTASGRGFTSTRESRYLQLMHCDLLVQVLSLFWLICIITILILCRSLRLSSNWFSGLLPDLSNLVNLTNLDLSSNYITGSLPQSYTNMPSLTQCHLQKNCIGGFQRGGICSILPTNVLPCKDSNKWNLFFVSCERNTCGGRLRGLL